MTAPAVRVFTEVSRILCLFCHAAWFSSTAFRQTSKDNMIVSLRERAQCG